MDYVVKGFFFLPRFYETNVFVCLSPRHPLFLLALAKNALHGDSGLTKGGSSDLLLAVPQAPLLILHLLMLLLGVISQKTDMSAALRRADDRDPCISQTGKLLNLPQFTAVPPLMEYYCQCFQVYVKLCAKVFVI